MLEFQIRGLLLVVLALTVDARSFSFLRSGAQPIQPSSSEAAISDLSQVALLLVSSPVAKKVNYAVLENLQAIGGAEHALIDAGLDSPHGLALDSDLGLFVADPGLGQILRYQLKTVSCEGSTQVAGDANTGINIEDAQVANLCAKGGSDSSPGPKLALLVDGAPTTIVMNTNAAWVATDSAGALYYSDLEAKSVNRVPPLLIRDLLAGSIPQDEVKHLSVKDAESLAIANSGVGAATATASGAHAVDTDAETSTANAILTLHQAGSASGVGVPGAVAVDGAHLYWTNQEGGVGNGSVVVGLSSPIDSSSTEDYGGLTAFMAQPLVHNTDSANGLAITPDKVIYTGKQHGVYAADRSGGSVTTITNLLDTPRGIVWDRDGTIFVADEDAGQVFSFPSGRITMGMTLSQVLTTTGPFGLAVLQISQDDPIASKSVGDKIWSMLSWTPWSSATNNR
jgi:hypothetical protein